jgi:uncharacterized membrane protein
MYILIYFVLGILYNIIVYRSLKNKVVNDPKMDAYKAQNPLMASSVFRITIVLSIIINLLLYPVIIIFDLITKLKGGNK